MVRIRISAVEHHQVINGKLTGAARATVWRRLDPIRSKEDGPGPGGNGFGRLCESTLWDGLVSSPGPVNPAWLHPDTGLPMSMNPNSFIIEGEPPPPGEPLLANLFNAELQHVITPQPPPLEDLVVTNIIQKRTHQLITAGVFPIGLTPVEWNTLQETRRLLLVPGRFLNVFGLRPTPPT